MVRVRASTREQAAINARLYRRPGTVRQYTTMRELYPAEAAALARYRDDLVDRAVLDLGCGAGRLAVHVQPFVARYLGLDISPHMVSYCRSHLPDLEFAVGDMLELHLADESFGAIFAIANLFDAVDHVDRLRVLRAVHRLLAPGGLLVFSSHNRNWSGMGAPPTLDVGGSLRGLLRGAAEYALARAHQLVARVRRLEHHTRDYSVVTDPGHDFRVLHYYIARATQSQQLAHHGFSLLDTFSADGHPLSPSEPDHACPSLVYVARRV